MKIKAAVTKEASNLVPGDYQLEKTVTDILRQATIRERSKLTQTYFIDDAYKKTFNDKCVGVSESLPTNTGKSPYRKIS